MKIVAVTWNDAHGGDGRWKEMPEAWEPCEVVTIGYLREFEQGLAIISSHCPNMPESGEYCFGVTFIPKGFIVGVEVLRD